MKTLNRCLLSLLILSLTLVGYSQTQHIHSEFMKDGKETRVQTNFLYLNDSPEEFLEIQFEGWFKGQTPEKPPRLINLSVYAISNRGRYRNDNDRMVVAVADGDELKLGTLDYFANLNGETNKGNEAFFAKGGSGVGIQIPVPHGAQVRDHGKIDGLTAEMMSLKVKLDQLARLANAKALILRIGKSSFTIREGHMEAIREFTVAITPK
jgi:hypothetical protein